MAYLLSVNVGSPVPTAHSDFPTTSIDKRPVTGPVEIAVPGPRGTTPTGLLGDSISDVKHHGGPDQAVYAYAREDLDRWAAELGRELTGGVFGENLTTQGLAVTDALIGERWRIGDEVVLEVSAPRIPCRTFAGWLDEPAWIKRFTVHALPGAYLRVVRPGSIRAGDPVEVVHSPNHDVTIGVAFRALTLQPDLLPRLLAAEALPESTKEKVRARLRPPGSSASPAP
ncbi:MOSC domain-containing protein [Dactylosporangium sp. AC04546]|uniref:MOSC domain-containing protein n=1 Tax=Dactylosporangium sp. AC04546 TaxID=2862460 RepID=UPI001EDDBC7B|nr:MOSC domain-containing protein [Dactylosporangium sp. AC04546]WVK82879.1 MOSC domain-containing protein [Dactylosporangium sp. AC04546]